MNEHQTINVKQIVKKYLIDNGFDGLFTNDCGCKIDDLMPCSYGEECQPGYLCKCNPKTCRFGNCEWHIGEKKDKE
jgi:hypothetical protein